MKKKIYTVIEIVLIASICYTGYHLIKNYRDNSRHKKVISRVEKMIEQPIVKEREVGELVLPDFTYQMMTKESYAKLKKKNSDFIGYLYFDSGLYKQPIVQGKDNSYYLNVDFEDKYNPYGAIFMNYQNKLDDMNITIYGHVSHGNENLGWHKLNFFKDKEWYLQNRYFSIYYADEIRRYKVLYACEDGKYDHQFKNISSKDFDKYFADVKSRSKIVPDEDMKYGDRFVTLQTCKVHADWYKWLVIAKEVGRERYKGE